MVSRLIASIALVALVGCQKQTVIKREPILNASSDTQPRQSVEEFFSRPPLYIQHSVPVKKTVPPFWPPHKFTPIPDKSGFLEHTTSRRLEKVNNTKKPNSIN